MNAIGRRAAPGTAADTPAEALEQLGLDAVEARTYLALVELGEATRPRLEEALALEPDSVERALVGLEQKGLAGRCRLAGVFVPLPIEEFLESQSASIERAAEILRRSTAGREALELEALWRESRYDALLGRARRMLREAQSAVLAGLPVAEFDALQPDLEHARSRGVELFLIVHASVERCRALAETFGDRRTVHVYAHAHPLEEGAADDRHVAMVVDEREALLMDAQPGGSWRGVVTSNPAVVRTAANYIRHDVYLNRLALDLEAERRQRQSPTPADAPRDAPDERSPETNPDPDRSRNGGSRG